MTVNWIVSSYHINNLRAKAYKLAILVGERALVFSSRRDNQKDDNVSILVNQKRDAVGRYKNSISVQKN